MREKFIMRKVISVMLFTAVLCGCNGIENGSPIRPLAQDCVIVERSKNVKNPLYTPSIFKGDNDRLISAFEYGHFEVKGIKEKTANAHIVTSDDGGKTWTLRAKEFMTHGRIFKAGKSFYYLGHRGNLRIMKSDDNGETWSKAVDLTSKNEGKWHQSACNVWYKGDYIYLVMEVDMLPQKKLRAWNVSKLAPVVMRAKVSDDLTKRESWTFSNRVSMASLLEDYEKDELPQLNFFGVPFYKQTYGEGGMLRVNSPTSKVKRFYSPMGILETNIVQIKDKNHIWYDSTEKTFHLLMRANTGGTGYGALLKAVEKDDGSIQVGFEYVPSGKKILFLPIPGGQMRFHIEYDEKTKLYWLLGTQATDSMVKPNAISDDLEHLGNNERQRMVLHFSKNLVDWCFAGVVAKVEHPKAARHYASMAIDGDDLVILSRSGDENAKSAHDGNLITFHRVKNFRDLVY